MVKLNASYRLNLLLLKGQRCVDNSNTIDTSNVVYFILNDNTMAEYIKNMNPARLYAGCSPTPGLNMSQEGNL